MISEKRTRRPPEAFQVAERKPVQKEKKVEKKRKVTGSEYELIPVPQKYEDSDSFFLTYGNFPLLLKDDQITSNFSMLDQFHVYRGVYTSEFEGQKLVAVQTERKPSTRFPRWKTLVKKMGQGGKKGRELGKFVKDFSMAFEMIAGEYISKVTAIYAQKGGKEKVAAMKTEIDQKKRELFLRYPYIHLRSSFRGSQTELDEIIVNERLLQLLGYSTEDFASAVINEGFPKLLAIHLEDNSDVIQNTGEYGHQQKGETHISSKTLDFALYTRSNYIKEAKIQVDNLINHDEKEFKCDLILTVLDHNYPYSLPPIYNGSLFRQSFIDMMLGREKEMETFFQYIGKEYNFAKFSNQHKICKIKELPYVKEEAGGMEEEPTTGSWESGLSS
jgi:hypothetical protein